jgi:hypothetical protein
VLIWWREVMMKTGLFLLASVAGVAAAIPSAEMIASADPSKTNNVPSPTWPGALYNPCFVRMPTGLLFVPFAVCPSSYASVANSFC